MIAVAHKPYSPAWIESVANYAFHSGEHAAAKRFGVPKRTVRECMEAERRREPPEPPAPDRLVMEAESPRERQLLACLREVLAGGGSITVGSMGRQEVFTVLGPLMRGEAVSHAG